MSNVVIVEDSTNTSELLCRYLGEIGLESPSVFERGESFLEWLEEIDVGEDLDLVLLDWLLPGLSGLDVLGELNEAYDLTHLPVLMVTSKTRPEELEKAFQAGCMDYVKKPINKIELQARVNSALRLKRAQDEQLRQLNELRQAREKLEKANDELEQLTREDGLTGLSNKREFSRCIRQEWNRALRNHTALSLIIIDVDKFKPYNDTYGHEAGDRVLKRIGTVIAEYARRPADCASRFGGEEFALILPDTPRDGALDVARKIRHGVEELSIPHENHDYEVVTVSAGVHSTIPSEDSDHEDLIRLADNALYQAKAQGRNQVCRAMNVQKD